MINRPIKVPRCQSSRETGLKRRIQEWRKSEFSAACEIENEIVREDKELEKNGE